MKHDIKPLYRKVNTCAIHHHHQVGSDARYDRNTKDGIKRSMKKNVKRGLDYTPLYNFLLTKIGQNFDAVYSEAVKRLDNDEAIFVMIIKKDDGREFVRTGENSYYSALYVDENNLIQKINPNFNNENLTPYCACCTHTFNGKVLIKKFIPPDYSK